MRTMRGQTAASNPRALVGFDRYRSALAAATRLARRGCR
jgi:hypothetical protein